LLQIKNYVKSKKRKQIKNISFIFHQVIISVRSKLEDTEEAFRELVSLDFDRILYRLRSHHANLQERLLETTPHRTTA
jgi:hypothetical protein